MEGGVGEGRRGWEKIVKYQIVDVSSEPEVGGGWGQSLVDICMKLEDGKFLIVKDPNKPVIR